MNKLSNLLLFTGIALLVVAGWVALRPTVSPQDLVELRWETEGGAKVGTETPTSLWVTNRSDSEARVVGLNHC